MPKRHIFAAILLNAFRRYTLQTKVNGLLHKPLVVINLGLRMFAQSLKEQKVEVIQVDWVPPAGGDKAMADLLDQLL